MNEVKKIDVTIQGSLVLNPILGEIQKVFKNQKDDMELSFGMGIAISAYNRVLNSDGKVNISDLSCVVNKNDTESIGVNTERLQSQLEIGDEIYYRLGNFKTLEDEALDFISDLIKEQQITIVGNEDIVVATDFGKVHSKDSKPPFFGAVIEHEVYVDPNKVTEEILQNLVNEKEQEFGESMKNRLTYLKDAGCSLRTIRDVFKAMRAYPTEYANLIPQEPEIPFIDSHHLMNLIAANINIGSNIYLEGPYGTGKNVLARTVAWLYRRPIFEFSINAMLSNNALLGSQTFYEKDGEKTLKFEPSIIIKAAEVGGVLVLDELNTGRAETFSFLHSLLDGRRSVQVPQYKNVVADKDFFVVATGNKGYEGTKPLNAALQSRFTLVEIPHSEDICELLPVELKYHVKKIFNELYSSILSGIKSHTMKQESLSVRGFERAALLIGNQDFDVKAALMANVVNNIDSDADRNKVEGFLNNIL